MRIQELKPSQRVAGRWLLVLDNGSILQVGEEEMLSFSLYCGMELSDQQTNALLAAMARRERKEKVLELLARKPQSRKEVARRLERWKASEEETQILCDRMEELGFLNDGEYAQRIVRHYQAKGFGKQKLRDELYRRGVPRELWQEALDQMEDSGEVLERLIAKRMAGKEWNRQNIKKTADALTRRGFSWWEIQEALERVGAVAEED